MTVFTEVTLGEHVYQVRSLTPMQQFHVTRRVMPILVSLGVTADASGKPKLDSGLLEMLSGPAAMLAKMSDQESEYIINTCLLAVYRKAKNGYVPVIQGGINMFSADLDLPEMLNLVWEVGKANLSGFMATFQSLRGSAEAEQA